MYRFVSSLTTSAVQLESISVEDLSRIHKILEQYADSQLDFTDAAIVAIAERLLINRIYTLDRRDFTIIRPKHCDYFELLPWILFGRVILLPFAKQTTDSLSDRPSIPN